MLNPKKRRPEPRRKRQRGVDESDGFQAMIRVMPISSMQVLGWMRYAEHYYAASLFPVFE
jgi:hypothetical protein